jgi:hypothetical protein
VVFERNSDGKTTIPDTIIVFFLEVEEDFVSSLLMTGLAATGGLKMR